MKCASKSVTISRREENLNKDILIIEINFQADKQTINKMCVMTAELRVKQLE